MAHTATDRTPAYRLWAKPWYLFLLVCCGAGAYFAAKASIPAAPKPAQGSEEQLEIDESDLDLGQPWESRSFAHRITLRNRGPTTLSVLGVHSLCGCMAIEPEQLKIPSGASSAITARIDLSSKRPAQPTTAWKVQVPLLIEWQAGDEAPRQSEWIVTGTAKAVFDLEPTSLDFSDRLIRAMPGPTLQIDIKPRTGLNRLTIGSTPPGFDCMLRKSGGKYTLTATAVGPPDAGPIATGVELLGTDQNGVLLPPLSIRLTGTVSERVICSPGVAHLGLVPVGSTATGTTRLVPIVPGDFDARIAPDRNGSHSIELVRNKTGLTVRFKQEVLDKGDGTASAQLIVTTRDAEIPVTVRWDWYGIMPSDVKQQ